MKKILILLTIVIGLTSCPYKKKHLDRMTIVKFTQEEYSQYVMGIRVADSVETYEKDIDPIGDTPVSLIYLCDGWWFVNAFTAWDFLNKYTAIGEMRWEDFNNLPEGEKNPSVSVLKDDRPFADITEIALDDIITPNSDSYHDVYYLMDYSPVIVQIREIIANGQLKKYRIDRK